MEANRAGLTAEELAVVSALATNAGLDRVRALGVDPDSLGDLRAKLLAVLDKIPEVAPSNGRG